MEQRPAREHLSGPPVEAITRLLDKLRDSRVACQFDCGERATHVHMGDEVRVLCRRCCERAVLECRFGVHRGSGRSVAHTSSRLPSGLSLSPSVCECSIWPIIGPNACLGAMFRIGSEGAASGRRHDTMNRSFDQPKDNRGDD